MGYVDNQQTEEALNDLREHIKRLQMQNKDLKDFIKHMGVEVTSFLNYNAIVKEL